MNLDLNNRSGFGIIEDVICSPVWENQVIWSGTDTRTDLPQSMIDAANASLS